MDEPPKFLDRIRGNAEWKAIETAWKWGSPVILPVVYAIYEKARHLDRDWYVIGFLLILGLLFSVLGFVKSDDKSRKIESQTASRPSAQAMQSQIAATESASLHADQAQLYILGSQISSMFSSIQIEALSIASDLQKSLDDLGPEPTNNDPHTADGILNHAFGARSVWHTKMRALYEDDFSPRIKRFLLTLRREGQEDAILARFSEQIKDEDSIGTIRARLWAIAAYRDGIDFQGNL